MIKFNESEYRENLKKQINEIYTGKKIADEIFQEGFENIFLIGVGGTYAVMMHFAEIAKQYTNTPVYLEQAGEIILTGHKHFNKNSIVFMASESGDTKEIVEFAKYCQDKGVRVVSLVSKPESKLAKLSNWSITFIPKGVEFEYLSMIGIFYGLLNNNGDFEEFDLLLEQLEQNLINGLVNIQTKFDNIADDIAKKYYNSNYMLWIGSGELWGEVYLFSMCILEEMQWLKTKSVRSSEFFHGTLELIEKDTNVFLLKGEGACRKIDERAERFLKEHTDNLVIFDTREYRIENIDEKFANILSPIVSTVLLNGRLSKHFEANTGHSLDIRRYYRQFDY